MKKAIIAGAVVVLMLDWAALHDILKGNEPSFASEWTMVLASMVLLPALAVQWKRAKGTLGGRNS